MSLRRVILIFLALILALFFLSAVSLTVGVADISLKQIFDCILGKAVDSDLRIILFEIRAPRLFAAIFAGSSLAVAGCAMQTLFRNPLADPSITGVSSGAALGAALSIFLFAGEGFSLQIFALLFGLFASFAVWKLGKIDGKVSAFSILLAGIAVNAFCGAIVGFLMYAVREAGLKGFIFWTLGSLDACTWSSLGLGSFISFLGFLILILNAKTLNMLSLGEDAAYHSGANVKLVQFIAMLCAAAMTASCVSLCGIIGFVGLVVPHIMRLISVPDNRILIPLSALGGATLLVFADIIARAVNLVDNVPVGVITALIGAPFFLILLRRASSVRA